MQSINFLVWNIDEKALDVRIGRLAIATQADVVVLVEPGNTTAVVRSALAALGPCEVVSEPDSPIAVFSRSPALVVGTVLNSWRWQILTLRAAGRPELLLAVTHLPSKNDVGEDTQLSSAIAFCRDIERQESLRGHARTVVAGDLNMNPFERGVMFNHAFNATATRSIAERETRSVQHVGYPLFYNPMWGCFGDRTRGAPGSFYRSAGEAVNYHWNIYDQVLVRPALTDALGSVRILDHDGQESLLTANGLPDKQNGSDHLPLYFRLNWDRIRS